MSFRFERGIVVLELVSHIVILLVRDSLLKAKWTISQKCHCKNKFLFDQMIMMMAALYYINMVS